MPSIKTIQQRCAAFIGEPVNKCAILFPPVPYHVARERHQRASRGHGLGQVGPAVVLAEGEALTGMAARLPHSGSGILAVGETEVHFLKFKIGGSPKESVASWPAADVSFEFVPKDSWDGHRGVRLVFSDGSSALLKGERRWGVKQFE